MFELTMRMAAAKSAPCSGVASSCLYSAASSAAASSTWCEQVADWSSQNRNVSSLHQLPRIGRRLQLLVQGCFQRRRLPHL